MSSRRQPTPDAQTGDRRDEVARATWRVIAREGLDRASMRAIAQELGCTTGVLTHYFRDKDALLDFALAAIIERLQQDRDLGAEEEPTLLIVRDWLAEALPATVEGRLWWKVWLSFTVASFSRERQGADHAELYANLRRYWTQIFTRLRDRGVVRADIDPAVEAESLLCLVDGLGVQSLISPRAFPARRQVEIVENYLARIAI